MKNLWMLLAMLAWSGMLNAQNNLFGNVTDSQQEPLPGATIELKNLEIGSMSDPDGFFRFANLADGDYTLVVSYLGYETVEKDISLKNGSRQQLDFVLNATTFAILPVVVTGSWVDKNIPMTYSNVSKEELEKLNLGQDVPYLLRWTPSAVVTSDAGTGIGYTGIRIRGTDPSRINVSINGIPLNDSESQGTFWVDLPDFASSTDQVQIQRGVGTSTNGAGAFGATINMSTTQLKTEAYGSISGSIGSFGTRKINLQGGTGLINNKFAFDGRLSKINSDGFIDRGAADLLSFYASGAYLGEKQSLSLHVFSGHEVTYQAWNGVPIQFTDIDNPTLNDEGKRAFEIDETFNSAGMEKLEEPHDNEVDDYTQTHYQLLYNRKINDQWNADMAFHYTRGKGFFEQYKRWENLSEFNVNVADTIEGDLIRRRWLDNHFYGVTYALNYNDLAQKTALTIGGALNKYDGGHYGEIIWTEATSDLKDAPRYYDNDGDKFDFNIFTKVNYRFAEKWSGYLDLQYRYINYEFLGFDNDGSNVTQDDQLHFFNPKLGVVFTPTNTSRFYGSFAVANREPNRSDYTESTPTSRPNHETLFNTELGYRQNRGKHSFGINLYHMAYKDQLVLNGQINDVGEFTRINVDKSYRLGLEIDGVVEIVNGLQLAGNVTLSQNKIPSFTEFVDSWDPPYEQLKIEHEDTDLSFSPSVVFGANLSYDVLHNMDNQSLSFSLMNKYVGEQFIDNTSNESTKLDAYFFSDFRLGYQMKTGVLKNVALTLLIRNIFDNRYSSNAWTYRYSSAGYDGRLDDPSTQLEGNNIYNLTGMYPQAGRNYLLGLTIGF